MLLQKTCPSWLYPVTMGATTTWERWDAIKPDTTFANPVMNSFCLVVTAATIGDWLYRDVAGIDTYEDGPGYTHIKIKPHIADSSLTSAQGTLQTYYGEVSSRWEKKDGKLFFDVAVPANTRATVFIPATTVNSVREDGQVLSTHKSVQVEGTEEGYVVVKLGSGKYNFTVGG